VPNVEFLVSGNEVGPSGGVGLIGQNLLQRWDVEYDLANGMLRLMRDEDCHGVSARLLGEAGRIVIPRSIFPRPTPESR